MAAQRRLQRTLVVATRTPTGVATDAKVMMWLSADWFVHVAEYVDIYGATMLTLLTQTSKSVAHSLLNTDVNRMLRYSCINSSPPWWAVSRMIRSRNNSSKRPRHIIPDAWRIPVPTQLCRGCFGANTMRTRIDIIINKRVVVMCERCMCAKTALSWRTVRINIKNNQQAQVEKGLLGDYGIAVRSVTRRGGHLDNHYTLMGALVDITPGSNAHEHAAHVHLQAYMVSYMRQNVMPASMSRQCMLAAAVHCQVLHPRCMTYAY